MALALRINNEFRRFLAGTLSASWSSDAPNDLQVTLLVDNPDDLPELGQTVDVWTHAFSAQAKRIWSGTIDEVNPEGLFEGSNHLKVTIRVLGHNNRLYLRHTRSRLTGEQIYFRGYESTVDVAGTVVLHSSGDHFGAELAGKSITINDVPYTVDTVDNPKKLTLTQSAGSVSGATFRHRVFSGDIVKTLVDNNQPYMDGEGFTYDSGSIQQGAEVKEFWFETPVTIAEALDKVLESNPTFTYWVDVDKKFFFGQRDAVPAPIEFTDITKKHRRRVGITRTREDVCNVDISIVKWESLDLTIETFQGDGATRGWFLQNPVGSLKYVRLNGVDQNVGLEGTTGLDYYYRIGQRGIWMDNAVPTLTSLDTLEVGYYPYGSNLIEYADSASIAVRAAKEGSSGRYETVTDRTGFIGQVEAFNESKERIESTKDDLERVRITTWEEGIEPGQLVQFQSAKFGVSSHYFVDNVTATDNGVEGTEYELLYTIEGISPGRRLTASGAFRKLSGKGGIGGAAAFFAGKANLPLLPTSVSCTDAVGERFLGEDNLTRTVIYPTATMPDNHRALWFNWYYSRDDKATWEWLGTTWVQDTAKFVLFVPLTTENWYVKAVPGNNTGDYDPAAGVESAPFQVLGIQPVPDTGVLVNAQATYTLDPKVPWAFYPKISVEVPDRKPYYNWTHLYVKLYNSAGQLHPDAKYQGKGQLAGSWNNVGPGSAGLQLYEGALGWTLPLDTEPPTGYRYFRLYYVAVTQAGQETICKAWPGGAEYGVLYVPESRTEDAVTPPELPIGVTAYEDYGSRILDHQNNVKTFINVLPSLPVGHTADWVRVWLSLDDGATWSFPGSPSGFLGDRWLTEPLRFEIYAPDDNKTARVKVTTNSSRGGQNKPEDAVVSLPFTIQGLGDVPEFGAITDADYFYTIDYAKCPWAFYPIIRWKNNPIPPMFASLLTVKLVNEDGDVHPSEQYQETPWGQIAAWTAQMGDNQYGDPNGYGWMLPPKTEPANGFRYFRLYLIGEDRNGNRFLTKPWEGGAEYGVMYVPESREEDPVVTTGGEIIPEAGQSTSEFKGERLSVTMFGAKGDGIANDAPAFNAAIAAAVAVGGGEIFVPRGTYKLDEPVEITDSMSKIRIAGCGSSSVILRGADLPNGKGLFDISGTDIEFSKFTVDGQVTTPATLQYGQFNPDPMINDLTRNTSFWVHGDVQGVSWNRVTVQHTGGYSILLDATQGDISNVKIFKCRFENNRPHLFGFDAEDLNYGSWTGGVHYQGDGANYAVSDLLVEGCTFRRNTGNCCWGHLYAFGKIHSNIRRKGNYFEDCGLDGILMGGEVGGCVEGNQFRRIGYICLDDTSESTPKRLQGAWAVAIDSAGLVRGVNVVGNTIVSANGGSIDLDGYSQGVVSGNTCIMPGVGEPEYTQDKIAQTGPGGTGNNWTYGINAGNTNNIELPGVGITIAGNTFINMGGGAIRMYCSRNSVIQGNNIIHPATANFPPIALGNTGTGPYQRARGNVVIDNKIDYSPAALSAAVIEDANIAAFEPTDKNWVAGNKLTGNCFEFQKHASSGSTSHVVISAVEHGLTTRSENIIQREGSGVYAVYRNYAVSAGGSLGLSSLFDHLTNGVDIIGGPLFNISRDGAAGTGSISTGPRTASQWDDAVLTGKLFSDSFLCMTGLTYSDAAANLMPDTYGLIRYDGTSHKFMFSDEVSSGVRVWKQFATLPSWVEFIPAQPPNGNILYVDGFIQSTGGFLTTGTAFNIIQAPYGGVTAKWLIGTDWFALTGVPGAGVELSNPGQGKIYFDSNLNRFRVSENAGAFKDLVGGFWQQKDAGPDIQYTAGNVWVSGRLLLNGAQLWGASPLVMKQVVGNPGIIVVDDTGVQPKNAHFGFDVNLGYLRIEAVHQNVQYLPIVFRCSNVGINTDNPRRTLHISSSAYTEFLIESTGAASGYGRIWAFTLNPANKMLALRRGNDDFSSAIGVIQFYPGGEVVVGPNVITPDHTFEVQGKMKADSLFLDGTGTLITILGALTADHEGNLSVTGIFSADGGVYTTNTSYNAIQSPFGGVTTKWLIGTESLSLMGVTPAPVGVGANEGRIYFDSVTKKFRVSEGGGSWVNLVGGGGGGVTSLNGLTGALSVVAGTGVSVTALGSSITVAIGQPVGTGNAVQFYSVLTSDAIQSNRAIGPAIYAPNAWIQGKGLVSAGLTARNSIQSTSGIRAGTDGLGGFWIGSGVEANSTQVINTLGQFVGAGVLCPSHGIQAAGFNPTGYNGQTFTLDFSSSGGFAVSGYGTFTKIHFVGGVFVSLS